MKVSLTLSRRAALSGLLKTLAVSPLQTALAQIAIHPATLLRASELPNGTVTKLPRPTASYDGTLVIKKDRPNKDPLTINLKVHGMGPVLQYKDWGVTIVANFDTGDIKCKAAGGLIRYDVSDHKPDIDLANFDKLPVTKLGFEPVIGEPATVFYLKGEIMPRHVFDGKIWSTYDGILMKIDGYQTALIPAQSWETESPKNDGERKKLEVRRNEMASKRKPYHFAMEMTQLIRSSASQIAIQSP